MRYLVPRHVNVQNNAFIKGTFKELAQTPGLLGSYPENTKHGKFKLASAFQSNTVPRTVYTLPTHAGRLVVHQVICC